MTTALDIIKRAMRQLGVLPEGETPSAQQSADGLSVLNQLMASLGNASQMIYAQSLDQIPLVTNQAAYTIGPTGSFVTQRPVKILASSFLTYQGVSYPLVAWNLSDYNQITVKTIGGIPTGFWALMDFPDITVTFWPLPSQSPMVFNMWSLKQITEFTSLTQQLDMPPGYDRALSLLLGIDLAPEFLVEPTPTLLRNASQARKLLKRTNAQIPRLVMPYGIPDNSTYLDWRSL
ncbi:hypothetical protein [Hydrogenophaga laconesensis]|uniref:Uncharacterized protein n=1 Tax=Hydrogenophaga laconesensis TaxID=1805971 RepID=A0ABU1V9N1_9BURK|nr:hypothetical protein [Hydrogenophaga laconesensis]MDR7094152.1 hypothetical protein [Hydrogenophaga laconesensis]